MNRILRGGRTALLLLGLVCPAMPSRADADAREERTAPSTRTFTSFARAPDAAVPDSLAPPAAPAIEAERAPRRSQSRESWPNPTITLVKSMVVPGWGQITNRRYLKAAIAIGLESWFIAGAVSEWRQANDALSAFRTSQDYDDYYDYSFHNGNKNDYLWALGVTVFISMFDAYVDAHLRPYQVDRIPDVDPPPGVALVLVSF